MNNGGVVRKIDSWGTFGLPQRMKRHAGYNTYGEYVFCSRFRAFSDGRLKIIPF